MAKKSPAVAHAAPCLTEPRRDNVVQLCDFKPARPKSPAKRKRQQNTATAEADPMLAAALGYAARGWPVFPCAAGGKKPCIDHWQHLATTDPEQLRKWWSTWPNANVALHPGEAGLLVLDFDPKEDRDKAAIRADVEAKAGKLPKTGLVARTPRGGEHHYYQLDPGDDPVPNSAGKLAQGLDVRSFRGYVLLPPGSTEHGSYEWVSEDKPARRSDALLEVCGRDREKDADSDSWIIEPDLPENITMAREWLRGERAIGKDEVWCKPAVEGQGGDNTTFATAAMMKSCGLSSGTALEAMWQDYNPRCDPPWEYEDLAAKVQNGYEYNTSPPGNVTLAYHVAKRAALFEPVKAGTDNGGMQTTSGRFRAVDRAGLQAITPPEWLLPDTLPEDALAMLSGRPGSYKTFIALDMALTVATGGGALRLGEWRGMWDAPNKPGPVLYVAGEGRAGLRQRVEAWEKLHLGGSLARDFVLLDPVPHIDEGENAWREFLAAAKGHHDSYRLVVLDTVARAMAGTNENASENATKLTRMADLFRHELGCTVLALHHTGYGNEERGRGSSAFIGDADTLLVSVPPEGSPGKLTALKMTKQKDWPEWDKARWCALEEISLGEGRSSLVSAKGEAPKATGRGANESKISLALADQHALAALRRYPMKEFMDADLAKVMSSEGVATDGGDRVGIGASEKTLRNTWLPRLREQGSGARVQPMYDALKKRWRYTPSAAGDFDPRP
ncbi:MAG: bifunctional DNA primase/polymerase [Kiloniellaceae bacterium]